MLIVEDNALQGGFGSAVIEVLADNNKMISVKRLGIPDKFITYGKKREILEDLKLSAEGVGETVREWLR